MFGVGMKSFCLAVRGQPGNDMGVGRGQAMSATTAPPRALRSCEVTAGVGRAVGGGCSRRIYVGHLEDKRRRSKVAGEVHVLRARGVGDGRPGTVDAIFVTVRPI